MEVQMPREQREEEITHELDFRPNFFSFLACQHSLETSLRNNPNGLVSSTQPSHSATPIAFSELPSRNSAGPQWLFHICP